MIFRGESKRIAESGVTPPAAGRPQLAGRRTAVAAAVGITAFVTIGAMSLSAASVAGATARTNTRDSSAGTQLTAAVIAAGAGTAVATTASAAIPPSPKFESSAPFGRWGNAGFIVNNNAWNPSTGPQTIWADSYRNWGVQSDQAADNIRVETYPSVEKNYDNVPVSSFQAIVNGFTESMPDAVGLRAEAADDVFLNDRAIEVMIWVDNHGQTPAGNIISHAVISNQSFAVWRGGPTYTFVLNHNETSGKTYISASIQWLMERGYVPASATLTQLDFGWEIASTDGSPMDFTVTDYWLYTRA
jgi:hypothetical protein